MNNQHYINNPLIKRARLNELDMTNSMVQKVKNELKTFNDRINTDYKHIVNETTIKEEIMRMSKYSWSGDQISYCISKIYNSSEFISNDRYFKIDKWLDLFDKIIFSMNCKVLI